MKVNIIKTSTVSSKMDEFVIENEVLYECNLTGTVVVPKNVTEIKATAFSNKTNITKVLLLLETQLFSKLLLRRLFFHQR